jgi:hypothetical protein
MKMTSFAGAIGAGLALLLGSACSANTDNSAAPTTSGQTTIVTPSRSPSPVPTSAPIKSGPIKAAPPARAAAKTAGKPADDLADGKHAVRITRVDPATRQITVDVVQFFTGDDAVKAAEEDNAEEIPPPNDYWIRNASPRLRTFAVAADASITVSALGVAESGSATESIAKTSPELAGFDHLERGLFWVTVSGDRVLKIAEQFLP